MSPALPTDTTYLLANATLPTYMGAGAHPSGADPVPRPDRRRTKSLGKRFRIVVDSSLANAKVAAKPSFWNSLLRRSFLALPAVFLGLLLNILDGVSYGMILFPAGKIFNGFGPMGVSMFFVT
jgi:sulfate permease, SulP family